MGKAQRYNYRCVWSRRRRCLSAVLIYETYVVVLPWMIVSVSILYRRHQQRYEMEFSMTLNCLSSEFRD